MRPTAWLALTAIALAGIVVAALRWVPDASLGRLLAAVAFVIVQPWLVAWFVTGVRPLIAAGRALVGRPEDATPDDARTLRLLGDVAPAAGALGALASFYAATAAMASERGAVGFDMFDRVLVASAVPLALGFVLKWCTFDAIARLILRAHDEPYEGITGLTAWRIVAIVCATALLVESVRRAAFAPAAPPAYDTSAVVTSTGFADGDTPIRIDVGATGFRIDGESLRATPGTRDELGGALVRGWGDAFTRPVEITLANQATCADVVGAIASCVRTHADETRGRRSAPTRPPIRIVAAGWPKALTLRLVRGPIVRSEIVMLQLAKSDASEAKELEPLDRAAIHITWDRMRPAGTVVSARQEFTMPALQAYVAGQRAKTRLVRPDYKSPCATLLAVLRILAAAGVEEVWLEVFDTTIPR